MSEDAAQTTFYGIFQCLRPISCMWSIVFTSWLLFRNPSV